MATLNKVVIDSFDDNIFSNVLFGDIRTESSGTTTHPSILGNIRSEEYRLLEPINDNSFATFSSRDGVLSISNGSFTNSSIRLSYRNFDSFVLEEGGEVQLAIDFFDAPQQQPITVRSKFGTNVDRTVAIDAGLISIPVVEDTRVEQFLFTFSGPVSYDITLSEISYVPPVTEGEVISEPLTLLASLFVGALILFKKNPVSKWFN